MNQSRESRWVGIAATSLLVALLWINVSGDTAAARLMSQAVPDQAWSVCSSLDFDGAACPNTVSDQDNPPYRYYLFSIGVQAGLGKFNYPQGVGTAPDGSIYVADTGNHRVQHFSPTGTLLNTWGSLGSGDGQFYEPRGVAVASDGSVYVADHHRIQRFASSGAYLGQWEVTGSGDGELSHPAGVAVAGDGSVYVVDTNNDCIQRYNAEGAYLGQWGTSGSDDGQFSGPEDVAVALDGSVYVADGWNRRIQRFDALGKYLEQWSANNPVGVAVSTDSSVYVLSGGWDASIQHFSAHGELLGEYGSGEGWFCEPAGLAVAPDGVVYVVDTGWKFCRGEGVLRFSSIGEYLDQWGGYGESDGQFSSLGGVAVTADGAIYTADSGNNRIQRFDTAGTYLGEWGAYSPQEVATATDGSVYVSDAWYHEIRRFSATGELLGSWGSGGSGDGQFGSPNGPSGIGVSADDTVYVADGGNNRVQRFSSTGDYIGKWGQSGSANGEFLWPSGVGTANDGTVYVADRDNNRIQRFGLTGGYLGQWGVEGTGEGQFSLPAGIAVGPDSTVYVADSNNRRVQHFDAAGSYLGQWGFYGPGAGDFIRPARIAVADDGTVYVADTGKNRVQVFGDTYPESWRGEYFGNRWLAERPLLIRDESAIAFDWGSDAPSLDLPNETFSARWQKYIYFEQTARYRFTLTVSDGARLWVGDRLLIEEWRHPQDAFFEAELELDVGYHPVRLEYYKHQGAGKAVLGVQYADTTPPESSASSVAYSNALPIEVSWNASDDELGVALTTLWVKFSDEGIWNRTDLRGPGTSGTFSYTPTGGEGRYYFATVATDRAGNVEVDPTGDGDISTIYDTTKPSSQVQVPELVRTATVRLPWSADDSLSGVSNTRLWVKVGATGPWTATDLSQTGSSGTFVYAFGQGEGMYHFATVATDRAGNQESSPSGIGDDGCEYRLNRVYLPLALRDYVTYFEGPWEVEPNDSYQQANGPVISGREYRGYPNDARDYFSVYTRQAGEIAVELTGHTGEGVQVQLFYQGIDNRVAYKVVGSGQATITHTGPAGWYYVYIYTERGHNQSTPYTLRATYPQ